MPYPRTKTFQRWEECERCGFDWPKSSLKRDYTGVKVCPECYDEKGHEEEMRNVSLKGEELGSEERIEPLI